MFEILEEALDFCRLLLDIKENGNMEDMTGRYKGADSKQAMGAAMHTSRLTRSSIHPSVISFARQKRFRNF